MNLTQRSTKCNPSHLIRESCIQYLIVLSLSNIKDNNKRQILLSQHCRSFMENKNLNRYLEILYIELYSRGTGSRAPSCKLKVKVNLIHTLMFDISSKIRPPPPPPVGQAEPCPPGTPPSPGRGLYLAFLSALPAAQSHAVWTAPVGSADCSPTAPCTETNVGGVSLLKDAGCSEECPCLCRCVPSALFQCKRVFSTGNPLKTEVV